jgi:hypothetical protein
MTGETLAKVANSLGNETISDWQRRFWSQSSYQTFARVGAEVMA